MTVYIAVCGPGDAIAAERSAAEEVGRRLAENGAVVVCGGLGGVMDAAARGARAAGGQAIGVLPGATRTGSSPDLTASIPTGLGEARNAIIVRAADAVIAISGEFGTLSEIALALKLGKPVIGLGTWELRKGARAVDAIIQAESPKDAVDLAMEAAGGGEGS
jgi:uncharacterized protein (TIGR00725 family)